MKLTPNKRVAKALGVSERHARKLRAKGDPRAVAAATARREQLEDSAERTKNLRKGIVKPLADGDPKLGIGATVVRLREYEHQLAMEVDAARKSGFYDEEVAAQKKWLAVITQLRQAENDAPGADAANRNQLPVADVEGAWTRGLSVFRKTLEAMARRVATKPSLGLSDTSKVKVEQAVLDEVAKALDELRRTKWDREA